MRTLAFHGLRFFTAIIFVAGLAASSPAISGWAKVTCEHEFKLSQSDTELSCAQWNLLENLDSRIVPGYSEAFVDKENGLLGVKVGGGLNARGDHNGGQAAALLRETFVLNGEWRNWLAVTVSLTISYSFHGHGVSQLLARLRTYSGEEIAESSRAGFRLRHDKFAHARLYLDEKIGEISLPFEGRYAARDSITLTSTSLVHHSNPRLDVRVDLLADSLPHLAFPEQVTTASIEGTAKIELATGQEVKTVKTTKIGAAFDLHKDLQQNIGF